MGGFFGAVSTQDVSLDIFFGVDYHSHLGTRRGGMIIYDQQDGFQRQIHSIENTPFRTIAVSNCNRISRQRQTRQSPPPLTSLFRM